MTSLSPAAMEDINNSNSTACNVARAILAVLDYNSTPNARKAAVAFLESIKAGDIRVLAKTSFLLVRKDWSSEIRLHAFKMLQYLVRLRWEELSPLERRKFANDSIELMFEVAKPNEEWPLKSQTAALVAEAGVQSCSSFHLPLQLLVTDIYTLADS